jgi:hypothetical protein
MKTRRIVVVLDPVVECIPQKTIKCKSVLGVVFGELLDTFNQRGWLFKRTGGVEMYMLRGTLYVRIDLRGETKDGIAPKVVFKVWVGLVGGANIILPNAVDISAIFSGRCSKNGFDNRIQHSAD